MLKGVKILLISSLILFATGAFAKVTITNSGGKTVYNFNVDAVTFGEVELNKTKYLLPSLAGVKGYDGALSQVGFPEIPSVTFYVYADSNRDVKVRFDRQEQARTMMYVPKSIAPAQESLPKIAGVKPQFVQNRAAYAQNTFFPLMKYTVENAGSVRGRARQLVTVFPFSYNPKSGQYRLDKTFKVEVSENKAVKLPGVETFAFIIGSKYENSPSLAGYMKLKGSLGYHVETIVIGRDAVTPDEIRAKLQEIYRDSRFNLKHALIVGDIEDVPATRATTLSQSKFVTDHYYRAIDTDNYLEDLNAPDIGLGRITVKNEEELRGVIAKFTKYTMGTFAHTEWFDHPSFIATDDRYQVAEGSHNYAIDNFFIDAGYTGTYPNEVQEGADKLYAITYKASDATVVDHMRKGRFIINYSGHGATKYWAGPHVTQNDVRSLTDTDVLPFVISNACITGQFIIDESYAETWIKHPAGAIYYWGSMDSSYWDEDDILEKDMYHGIFDDGNRSFSSITQRGLSAVWKHYNGKNRSKYYWETYHAFGDPSIELRMRAPKAINVEMPNVLPYGITETEVTITDASGNPVKGLRVAISHVEGTAKNVRYTDAGGKVVLPLEGASVAEHYKVMVYGNDYETVVNEIFMASPDYPFFIVEDFAVVGSENPVITSHQEFDLSVTINNVSPIASTGGKLEIVSIDGNVKPLASSEVRIPALGGNQKVTVSLPGLKAGYFSAEGNVKVTLRWTSDEGESHDIVKLIAVERPMLAVTAVDFGDVNHPQDGGMAPLESGNLWVTVTNSGNRVMKEAALTVRPLSSEFTMTGTIAIPSLAPGKSVRIETPFDVTLLEGAENDEVLPFEILGTHTGEFGAENLKAQGSFVVGKYGFRSEEYANIALPIVDKETAEYEFGGLDGINSIKDLSIHIKIKHTYVGDLTLTLVHPSGTEVVLRKSQGGGQDDIDEVFGVGGTDVPTMKVLNGLPTDGSWKLKVYDKSSNDTGSLEYIKIDVKGFI